MHTSLTTVQRLERIKNQLLAARVFYFLTIFELIHSSRSASFHLIMNMLHFLELTVNNKPKICIFDFFTLHYDVHRYTILKKDVNIWIRSY